MSMMLRRRMFSALGEYAVVKTVKAALVHITDALAKPAKKLIAYLNPIQDLHGYDNPWPAGGGKNKFPPLTAETKNGITLAIDNGVITLNTASGGATSDTYFDVTIPELSVPAGTPIHFYAFNPSAGSSRLTLFAIGSNNNPQVNLNSENASYSWSTGYQNDNEFTKCRLRVPIGEELTNFKLSPYFQVGGTAPTAFSPYSNICPITGHTGVDVVRTGKNLIKAKYSGRTHNDVIYTVNDDGSISMSGTASGTSYAAQNISSDPTQMQLFKAGQYKLSGGISSVVRLYFGGIYADGSSFGSLGYDSGNGLTATFTKDVYIYPQIVVSSGTNTNGITVKPMLVRGSDVQPYEAPTITTIPITFPVEAGTVYGGEVDATNGELKVTYVKFRPDPTKTAPTISDLGDGWVRCAYSAISNKPDYAAKHEYTGKYSHGTYDNRSWDGKYNHAFVTDSRVAYFYFQSEATQTAVTDYVASQITAGTPLEVVYEISEPITYQLTPTQLQMLLGENNLWHDGNGDLELTYLARATE